MAAREHSAMAMLALREWGMPRAETKSILMR
jgi:hypothetical protein